MAYIPSSGSILAFEGSPPWLVNFGNSSILVNNGSVLAFQSGTWISSTVSSNPSSLLTGASIFGQLPSGTATLGSVVAYQGVPSWNIGGSVLAFQATTWPGSVLAVQGVWSGSVLAQQLGTHIASVISSTPSSMLVGASIIGLTPVTAVITGNPSVSGTVLVNNGSVVAFQSLPSSLLTGASLFGQLPAGTATLGSVVAYQGIPSWNVAGSVLAQQMGTHIASVVSSTPSSMLVGASIIGLTPVTAVVTGNPSVSGTVNTLPLGTIVSSLVSTVPSSVIVGASLFGQLPAGTALIGSVATLQGTNPWTMVTPAGSVQATLQSGTHIASVVSSIPSSMLVGDYAQRNDALASALGGNLTWNPIVTDSAGRILIKPFTSDDGTLISYVSSVTTTSVTLLVASVIGKKHYVTDFWLANTGAAATRVTFKDGATTVLAETMVGAGGTTNVTGLNVPFKTAVSQDLTIAMGTATSMLLINVRGYQAP